jgi:membrane-associated protease RseP (regulator of RpoE activity)
MALIIPFILFIFTFITALFSGAQLEGVAPEVSPMLLKGLPFAIAVILIVGAHGVGHYWFARKYKIKARLPLFIPSLFIFGTFGAFTKMQWPIKNRRDLLFIFSSGPICGFIISLIIYVIGLSLSEIVSLNVIAPGITLNNSLITLISEKLMFGNIPDSISLQLHPIAIAGWMGFYYNLWHLFPIGKLDGGRIMYSIFGYRITKWVSYWTIIMLIILSIYWTQWINMATFGIICMVHLRRQYPYDIYREPLDNSSKIIAFIIALIFVLSFSPRPIEPMNLGL